MEHAVYPYPIWAVCGCSGAAICVGVLEKGELDIYSGSHSGTWCGLFFGAVHAHRFLQGKSNWYLPLALGQNCVALFINAIQRKKNEKDE